MNFHCLSPVWLLSGWFLSGGSPLSVHSLSVVLCQSSLSCLFTMSIHCLSVHCPPIVIYCVSASKHCLSVVCLYSFHCLFIVCPLSVHCLSIVFLLPVCKQLSTHCLLLSVCCKSVQRRAGLILDSRFFSSLNLKFKQDSGIHKNNISISSKKCKYWFQARPENLKYKISIMSKMQEWQKAQF